MSRRASGDDHHRALTISVGSTDFGSIEPGAMSPYREIGVGELAIVVE